MGVHRGLTSLSVTASSTTVTYSLSHSHILRDSVMCEVTQLRDREDTDRNSQDLEDRIKADMEDITAGLNSLVFLMSLGKVSRVQLTDLVTDSMAALGRLYDRVVEPFWGVEMGDWFCTVVSM